MKILYIGHEKATSGASKSLLEMMGQVSRVHEIYVLSAYRKSAFADEVKKAGFHLVQVPFFRWRLHFKGNTILKFIKKNVYRVAQVVNYVSLPYLLYYIKKEGIEFIHTNTTSNHIGYLLAKYTGLPHVLHVRECGENDFDMCFLWKDQSCFRIMNRYTHRVVYISQAVKEHYDGKLLPESRVIYNGVGKEYGKDAFVRTGKNRPLNLLIAGRIEPAKGQKEAMQAVAELVRQGIRDIRLYVAGSGNVKELKDFAIELGIEDQVVFLGQQTDMPSVRKKMDVELVCSACEAFGRVTVEAFMSGMPVIGSASGGTKELIQSGENGLLYPPGDYRKLAEQIRVLLESPGEVEKMSRYAMAYAQEHFTAEQNGQKVLQMYDEMISANEMKRCGS